MKQKISITIDERTLKEIDSIVDNVLIRNRSQAIEFLTRNALGDNKVAVILSGGSEKALRIGKDYRITVPIKNSTLIEVGLRKLKRNGFKEVYIIARKKILTKLFDIVGNGNLYGITVHYVEESQSRGTAESLKLIKGMINNTFLVVYGDIIFNKINLEELWKQHVRQKRLATLMLTTSATPTKKGIVRVEGTRVIEFIQKPRKSDIYIGFSSMFIAEPDILSYKGNSLENEIFPQLAKKGLLNGHLSSEKEIHVHNEQDVKTSKF
ncbi:hypothetical protein HON01_05580 [Candidatus Woesearchaeota archaeon]|jgi:NDP-sugar pyrophosphorylase family protein|nr:hypothetical protein [Candidatus Woesearchaeota archaeon]